MKFSLNKVLVGTVLAFAMGSFAHAETITLKFSHEAPATSIKGRTAQVFADKVKELSNGDLEVNIYPGAQLIATKDEVRAVIRGEVDFIAPQTNYYQPFEPGWDAFYQPLIFDSPEAGMQALQGDIGRNLLKKMEPKGMQGMGIWHDGPGYLFVTEKPILEPGDTKGRKIRVFPSAPLEEAVRRADGIPVSMPAPDVYTSLQQNLLDGVITAVTYAADAQWYEVLKGATKMTMFIGGYAVTMNKPRWDSLSDENKKIIMEAMQYAEDWNYNESKSTIKAAEDKLAENGVEIITITPEALKDWREILTPIYEKQPEEVRAIIQQIMDK